MLLIALAAVVSVGIATGNFVGHMKCIWPQEESRACNDHKVIEFLDLSLKTLEPQPATKEGTFKVEDGGARKYLQVFAMNHSTETTTSRNKLAVVPPDNFTWSLTCESSQSQKDFKSTQTGPLEDFIRTFNTCETKLCGELAKLRCALINVPPGRWQMLEVAIGAFQYLANHLIYVGATFWLCR